MFVQELSLPPVKLHCSMLAEDAIKAALKVLPTVMWIRIRMDPRYYCKLDPDPHLSEKLDLDHDARICADPFRIWLRPGPKHFIFEMRIFFSPYPNHLLFKFNEKNNP
jgi:hypothetical protein